MLFFGCSICIFFSSYNVKINYITNKNKLIAVIFLSSIVATFRFSIITWENFIRIIDNGYFKIPEQKYSTINVSDNLTINIPTNSKCYNIELPCVLRLNKSLYLIENNKGYPKMYYGIRK